MCCVSCLPLEGRAETSARSKGCGRGRRPHQALKGELNGAKRPVYGEQQRHASQLPFGPPLVFARRQPPRPQLAPVAPTAIGGPGVAIVLFSLLAIRSGSPNNKTEKIPLRPTRTR